jgi:branched-chain amino acid transport system substrate-binding protein
VVPAGEGAKGYKSMTFHAPGAGFKVFQDILKYVHDRGKGAGKREGVGEVLYNRAVINAMFNTEGIRTAMAKYGNKPLTAEEVRWGYENLNLTEKRLEEIGMKGLIRPLRVTCEDHEGNGMALVQQWDGKKWNAVSEWISGDRELVRKMVEESAAAYAKEKGIKPECMKG